MPVVAADIQNLLVLEVGDTEDGAVSRSVGLVWTSYADKASVASRLQELYTKRRLIDIALGSVRSLVDETTEGTTLRQQQRVTSLLALRTVTEAEITVIEARAGANRAAAVGQIATTAPIAPWPPPVLGPPDANSGAYSGTPYQPLRGWWP